VKAELDISQRWRCPTEREQCEQDREVAPHSALF
jgi:hypothetical protein